jgi:predicted nucleotidyltransferase
MRLSAPEIAAIKQASAAHFGGALPVRLFGSRVDDHRKGGDIDLLIEVPSGIATLRNEIAVERAITDRIGERRIDLILVEPGHALEPIERIACRDGVLL